MRLTGEQFTLNLRFLQRMAHAMTEDDFREFSELAGRLLDRLPVFQTDEDERILLRLLSKFEPGQKDEK